MLNNVWHKAICSEYSKVLELALKLARIPVTVVPKFEPSVNGNKRSIFTSPKPTKGIKLEVKTELL